MQIRANEDATNPTRQRGEEQTTNNANHTNQENDLTTEDTESTEEGGE